MIDSDIRDQSYQFFLAEAPELLQILETGLLNFRQERSPALVHDLMRSAHSIKGGAATVGLDVIANIAHRWETILRGLYDETVEFDIELETSLLQAYDCLKDPLLEQITVGSFDPELAVENADRLFSQIEHRLGDVLQQVDNYIPSSTELGVDMVSSIFEVDVAQGIERLAKVLEKPEGYEVAGELRAQAEVFAGFAEILCLPGFGAIALAAIEALDTNPERVLEIISVVLRDLEAARKAVLSGDRATGGSPSEALKALTSQSNSANSNAALEQKQADTNPTDSSFFSEAPTLFPSDNFTQVLDDFESLLGEPDDEDLEVPEVPAEIFRHSEPVKAEKLEISEVSAEILVNPKPDKAEKLEIPEVSAEILVNPKPGKAEKLEIPEVSAEILVAPEPEPVAKTAAKSQSLVLRSPSTTDSSDRASASQQTEQKTLLQTTKLLNSPANLKVKVDLDRLERMNNLVGELVIDRNSLALQQEQLQTVVGKIQQKLEQFRYFTSVFERMSEPTATSSNRPQLESATSSIPAKSTLDDAPSFDSLTMERYGDRHTSIQQVIEEMMQLEEAVEDLTLFTRQSERTTRQQQQNLTKLRDELMWARMLPLETILTSFPRALRDLSAQYQKPVELEMTGTDILVDKGILEKLQDPMLHLLRNAFDHGIEQPHLRRQQGKSATGKITIHAAHRGNRTTIEISDDGGGLDLMKIARRAIDRGWLSVEQLSQLDKKQLLDFIFEPGFSTAERVSALSGRGVGLDVVRSQLQAVKGTVTVDSSAGKGTVFTLNLPLTLTIARLLVCSVGNTLLALPVASIQEVILSDRVQTKQIGEQKVISWRDQLLPVYRLADLLDYRYPTLSNQNKTLANGSAMLVIRSPESNFALEVTDFNKEQEMVIKPITGIVTPPSYVYGCTVMGDGNLIPAIDAVALLAHTHEQKTQAKVSPRLTLSPDLFAATRVPTVLVVDDSATMRKTLALTLQKVNYRVLQARDGQEAIELLSQNSTIDMIVSDLEMPHLNGFEFLNLLRQDPAMSGIPVVMLTTRSNEKHRQLALHLGASAYLSKPYIEQEFLEVLRSTVEGQDRPVLNQSQLSASLYS